MQQHNLAHKNARLARVLYDIENTSAPRWEPSREELIKLRHMSRDGLNMKEAYEQMNLSITYPTFTKKIRKFAIVFKPPWSYRCAK